MIVCFYKTDEINGQSSVKRPLRSNAILNVEKIDKNCFLWSKLAYLPPCKRNHPNKFSTYKQYFNELNIQGFNFTNGFICSDVHEFDKINNLSFNIVELSFSQDRKRWKHKLIPFEFSKKETDRVIDLLLYKNHYALIKK